MRMRTTANQRMESRQHYYPVDRLIEEEIVMEEEVEEEEEIILEERRRTRIGQRPDHARSVRGVAVAEECPTMTRRGIVEEIHDSFYHSERDTEEFYYRSPTSVVILDFKTEAHPTSASAVHFAEQPLLRQRVSTASSGGDDGRASETVTINFLDDDRLDVVPSAAQHPSEGAETLSRTDDDGERMRGRRHVDDLPSVAMAADHDDWRRTSDWQKEVNGEAPTSLSHRSSHKQPLRRYPCTAQSSSQEIAEFSTNHCDAVGRVMSSTSAHRQSVRYYDDDPNNNHGRPIADPSTVDRSPSDFRAARDAIDAAARRADSGGLGVKEKKTNNNNRNKGQTGRGGYADGPRNGNTQGPDERLSPPPATTTAAASYKYDSGISTINTDGLKNLQSVYSDEHYNHQQQETEANYAIVDDHIGVVSPLGAVDESSSKRRMKVRQLGNQTIITEHRDPYSFYWQLDELRKVEEPRSRPSPRYDVVVDEESIIEEEEEEEDESDEVDVMQQKPLKFPPPAALPHENPYATPKRDDRPARVERLSHGWERHEDPSGYSYYWHVDSGQVQRDRPTLPPEAPEAEDDTVVEKPPRAPSSLVDASQQTIPLSLPPPPQDPRPMVVEEHAFRQTTTTKKHWADRSATDADEFDERRDGDVAAFTRRRRRFLVRSVGWTEFDVAEEHHAALAEDAETDPWAHYLREAFRRRHDDDSFRAHASRWAAEDRELILELSEKSSDDSSAVIANLSLLDASTMSMVDAVRCDAVYAWAVDQDDPRYFAYVALFDDTQQPPTIGETEPFGVDPRRVSTLFRCRVFRCGAFDVAHAIAETLDNICRRRRVAAGAATAAEEECGRPTSLHIITEDGDDGGGWVAASPRDRSTIHYNTPWRLARRSEADGEGGNGGRRIIKESSSLLLTPIDEPKRVIRCQFIGVTQVPKATGIEVLNEAVERLVRDVPLDRRLLVDVAIAPSSIQISEALPPLSQKCAASSWPLVAECRVRYLSFLGIGRDVKHCAFIMHSAPPSITTSPSSLAPHSFADNGGWTSPTPADCFHCYVFNVEPTAALMAKTIEAACKLRYQKVLDAHLSGAPTPRRTITRRTTTYQ